MINFEARLIAKLLPSVDDFADKAAYHDKHFLIAQGRLKAISQNALFHHWLVALQATAKRTDSYPHAGTT